MCRSDWRALKMHLGNAAEAVAADGTSCRQQIRQGAGRAAMHVARLDANGTPSAAEYRHALRQVVGRCIYGVDLNPMAVELCKVSLWMEAV